MGFFLGKTKSWLHKRVWQSATATTWLNQAVTPLRLLILTPLVLSRFTKVELDVFYLITSANLLFAVFQARLSDTFVKMLAYAFGGASDLSAWKPGKKPSKQGNEPSWELFGRCYSTLAGLQYVAALPALAFGLGTGLWSIGLLTDWDPAMRYLWLALAIAVVGNALDIITARYKNAHTAMNRVAFCNRAQTITSVAMIVTNSLAVQLGYGLVFITSITAIYTLLLRIYLKTTLPVALKKNNKIIIDRQIFGWAWPVLWRGMIAVMATLGAQRSVGLFLAATQIPGLTAQFLFSRNILLTIQKTSCAPLVSQVPKFSKMLGQDKRSGMVREAMDRIGLSNVIMLFGILGAGITVPFLMEQIGSQIEFLGGSAWWALGGAFAVLQILLNMGMVYNVTNRQALYIRSVMAAVIVVGCYWVGSVTGNIWWFIWGTSVPYILTINILPFRLLAELSDIRPRELLERMMLFPSIRKYTGSGKIQQK